MSLIESLNNEQKEAVINTEGPMLVIAGAGSGKTRVLTNRIAYLIQEKGVSPANILAITFTNKAAKEMKERLEGLIGEDVNRLWVSTFHSTCVRILRNNIEAIGYTRNFTIYDDEDKKKIIKDAMIELNVNEQKIAPRAVMSYISNNKNSFKSYVDAMKEATGDQTEEIYAKIYEKYTKTLKFNNALDFDDLIGKTIDLFNENEDILEYYREKFKYLLVDEYQDTNHAQYLLVTMLGAKYKNVFAVGDDDQSIYKWRGADISNILNFEKDYEGAMTIRLEQNYRSTQNILDLANVVIANNTERKTKTLWTSNGKGDLTTLYYAYDERDEAGYVTSTIEQRRAAGEASYGDFAVLYRTNAQSRVIEEQLVRDSIPYQMYGGLKFYDRKEVKDMLSYLKILLNPRDEVSIKRVINIPKRNIGNTTLDKIENCARNNELYLYEALKRCGEYPEISKLEYKIERFTSIIEEIRGMLDTHSLKDVVETLVERTGYKKMLEDEETQEAKDRIENLNELVSKVVYFESTTEEPTLEKFLEDVSLVADSDKTQDTNNSVKLMTIHTAKGLEFNTVFLVGFEDGIFPSYLSIFEEKDNELEEERRLLYVAITRAKKDLHISYTKSRLKNGQVNHNKVSRFYDEFPKELYENKKKKVKKLNIDINMDVKQVPNLYSMLTAATQDIAKNVVSREVAMSFSVGDTVGHKKFGQGMIQEITPVGNEYALKVNFSNMGEKKMVYNDKTSGLFTKF